MKIDVSQSMKNTSRKMLDAFVDSAFQFVDQPLLPSQSNLAPVEEIGEAVNVNAIEGEIPVDFPEGVYIRNGSNPLFGGLKSTVSSFGKTNQIWVEGEGMLHALYFRKNASGNWIVSYKNKFVESESFKIEKERNMPVFLPNLEGDSLAILISNLINALRLGTIAKHYQNVNIFYHSRKLYATGDNYLPQEVDISTLESLDYWDVNGAWDRPFTSHPKKAPGSGELVMLGFDGMKPYCVVGVISADGEKLLHKVDLKFNRSVLNHDIGVTKNYNVIIDHPLIVDITRVIKGGQLMKYEEKATARIGVMPRYGSAESVKWFEVEPNCTFHIVNCFEDSNEVVVRGCKAVTAIIPGPDWGQDKFEWFSKGFKSDDADGLTESGYLLHRVHEWRLNVATGEVKEKYLTGADCSMDFPFINEDVTGLKHKYGYTQVIDSLASSISGICKYGSVAKLHFNEEINEQPVKAEYHKFPENTFCTGSTFVPKQGGVEEDDGLIITFVHNEERNVSQVYIIDAKKFESDPIAILTLPQRVPYGHHGVFVSMPNQA
ncbi:PREDICTED: carotenoid 9,10(9',10')-cleavage dioxygenase 1-like [Populus euphratica]|uniref:Carotenoid 9,10(9',10')-cleavage dioxygenase 1-like n=1 Tax=Populus euphratica TaxID=75702 RepID=A0AAJ6T5U0_POPEU|nr:PREDICTED: carotenoid 9,10(9',10')-cleavage dioxygenase 1-like [Populus euphratica]